MCCRDAAWDPNCSEPAPFLDRSSADVLLCGVGAAWPPVYGFGLKTLILQIFTGCKHSTGLKSQRACALTAGRGSFGELLYSLQYNEPSSTEPQQQSSSL